MTQDDVRSTAERFLAIGGRLLIDPDGKVEAAISGTHLLSLKLDTAEREARAEVSRDLLRVEVEDPETLADLVRQNGQPKNGFIVWRAAA